MMPPFNFYTNDLNYYRCTFLHCVGLDSGHDLYLSFIVRLITQIRRGELREPERLHGYAKTIPARLLTTCRFNQRRANVLEVGIDDEGSAIRSRRLRPNRYSPPKRNVKSPRRCSTFSSIVIEKCWCGSISTKSRRNKSRLICISCTHARRRSRDRSPLHMEIPPRQRQQRRPLGSAGRPNSNLFSADGAVAVR